MTSVRWLLAFISLAGLILANAGCASLDAESDLPWNMSQPWESAPSIPFSGSGGGY